MVIEDDTAALTNIHYIFTINIQAYSLAYIP